MIDKDAINKLKAETKIGDKFGVYYHGKTFKNETKVVKISDKSIWFKTTWIKSDGMVESTSRQSWNTTYRYIINNVYRKI